MPKESTLHRFVHEVPVSPIISVKRRCSSIVKHRSSNATSSTHCDLNWESVQLERCERGCCTCFRKLTRGFPRPSQLVWDCRSQKKWTDTLIRTLGRMPIQ